MVPNVSAIRYQPTLAASTVCDLLSGLLQFKSDPPEVLSPLRDLVLQALLQAHHVFLEVGELQRSPDVLVTEVLKGVQVHPQRA